MFSAVDIRSTAIAGGAITLITEAYNLVEGQSEDAFVQALRAATAIARNRANVDTIVIDPSVDGIAGPIVARACPGARVLHLPGQGYDAQKNSAVAASRGEFVVFLDGDCRPKHDEWLETIMAPFADPDVPGVAGFTVYEDTSITGLAMTVLDFGFLFGAPGDAAGCYASNNVAFRREAFAQTPMLVSEHLRCACYKHAQLFARRGQPLLLEPRALVLHELPDVRKERLRRGYDYIAVLWEDPTLPETAWLAEAPESVVPRLVAQNRSLALQRLDRLPIAVGASAAQKPAIEREIRSLIEIDVTGIRNALEYGQQTGLNQRAVTAHREGRHVTV